MAAAQLVRRRQAMRTDAHSLRAAAIKAAACRHMEQIGSLAVDARQVLVRPGRVRQRRQQPLRIRMSRPIKDIFYKPLLDDAASIHDVYAPAHLGDDAEVVGNEDDGHAQPLLQLLNQRQYLRFRRHVESRRRLVGKEQPRLAGQGHGDEAALAHAARQLVRILAQPFFRIRNPYGLQQRQGPFILFPPAVEFRRVQAFANLAAYRQHRIQRGQGILEYHGHLPAPQRVHLFLAQGQYVPAVPVNMAVRIHRRFLRQQLHRRLGRNGFAAARFADDAHGLTGIYLPRYVVQPFEDATVRAERHGQSIDF